MHELRRYLYKGSFDVLPYTGRYDINERKHWWATYWEAPVTGEGNKILVSTVTVASPFPQSLSHLILFA